VTQALDNSPRTFGAGYLFGVPLKDLGWFATLLMALTTGFIAFFATTFVAIIVVLFLNSGGRHNIDYSWTYTRIGLPIGIVFGVTALLYLGTLWARRQLRRA
jgi:hypothetical protein